MTKFFCLKIRKENPQIGIFMRKFLFLIFILFIDLGFRLEAAPSYLPSNAADCIGETPSRITIRHRDHEGVGYTTGYTTLEAFLTPGWVRNFQPYADIRGHVMNDGKLATNVGLGARGAPIEELVIGGNFFFDYREASSMSSYQLGSGIEFLSPYIDFRLNGYLPVGHKNHHSKLGFERFEGNNVILRQRVKASLASIYAELGGWIPKLPENFQFYVAAGPYYLGSRHIEMVNHKTIRVGNKWGGKYRIAARIFEYFDAGIELTYDSLFHTNLQGYLGISFPLGPGRMYRGFKKQDNTENCSSSKKFRQRMTQPVYRNEIIPIYKKDITLEATTEDGQVVNFVFVNLAAESIGNGTFEAPFQSINEPRSLGNDYIVILANKDDDETPPFIIDQAKSHTEFSSTPSPSKIFDLGTLIRGAYKFTSGGSKDD